MANILNGESLYNLTSDLLLGFKMSPDLFYILLGLVQGNREQSRAWVMLRTESNTQVINPAQNNISNSMYLVPFDLPADFLNFYSPNRSLVLVANDGITFQWYNQIPLEYKQQYKDYNNKFYYNLTNKKYYLCGTLDQQYTAHFFYIASSPSITPTTSWVFPAQFHPILAFDVAQMYRTMFDYDVVNVQQGQMIEKGSETIFKMMTEWDGNLQEQALNGVEYQDFDEQGIFINKTVRG